ncbi:MAG: 50S ribosomal protein L12 [Nanoarchaeota archaeon]
MEYIYSALLLHKLGKEINEENIRKLVEAAGASADDSKIKSVVASLKGVDIVAELANASMAVAAPAQSGAVAEAKKEEKPKEEKREAAAEGLSALFG